MSERSGIEIDYCPECRGVWLDRGELDKLIERSAAHAAPAPTAAPVASSYERERDERQQHHQQRYSHPQRHAQQPYRKKRKESWLSEIFDDVQPVGQAGRRLADPVAEQGPRPRPGPGAPRRRTRRRRAARAARAATTSRTAGTSSSVGTPITTASGASDRTVASQASPGRSPPT